VPLITVLYAVQTLPSNVIVLSCNDRDRNYGNSFTEVAFIFHQISIKRYFYVIELSIVLNATEQNGWLVYVFMHLQAFFFLGTLKYKDTGVRWVIAKDQVPSFRFVY